MTTTKQISAPCAPMAPRFGADGVLESIQIGDVAFATGGGDLWTATFAAAGDLSRRTEVRAGEAASFEREEDGAFLRLRWRDIPLDGQRGVLNAVVEIETLTDGAQRWRLAFDNRSPSWALFETSFPRLNRILRDGEGDALLPWKDYGARLFRARRAQPDPERFDYLGYFPMVAAFFIGETGLYVAAEDPELRLKNMVVEGEQCLRLVTPVENAGVPDKAAEGPRYAVTLAPLRGDWWEAARRYRAFALRQPMCAKGPIRERPDFPRRACEVPLWINLHGSPDDIRRLLLRAKEIFPEFPTGVHWHLWQHSGHDINQPEYFPAQPGTKEAVADCLAAGQEPMLYATGRLWSVETAGYLAAEPFATMRADGTRTVEQYAPWTPYQAVMCPTQRTWQRVVQRFSHRAFEEIGAKSIFLDQIGAADGVPCFDPSHGHSVGGGSWWREGYRELLEPILRDAHAHGAYVATEGSGEAAIGLADALLTIAERTPEDVPFYRAVYSGYAAWFGSAENNDDAPAAFRALQTRELLWGSALGWFLPDILDHPDKIEILRRLCSFRQDNLDALAYGTLLDELRFVEPVPAQTYEWLGRRPNYQLFDRSFKLPPSLFATMPDVIGAWWRTDRGETILLAANLADEARTVRYIPFGAASGDTPATLALAPHELRRVMAARTMPGPPVCGAGESRASSRPEFCRKGNEMNYKLNIGVQMWSIDDIWKKDPAGALRRLRAMGYAGVQSMGFFTMDWDELEKMLEGEGLRIVDMPFTMKLLDGDGESRFLDFCGRFGVDFAYEATASASMDGADFKTSKEWRRHIDELAGIGERFAARGIRVGYHNHQYEIRNRVDGERPIDLLFKAGMAFELDVGHLKLAGENPVEWLGKLKGRVPSIHAKPAGDKSVGGPVDANDWNAILQAAAEAEAKWAVVECAVRHDTFEDVEASMGHFRSMGL